MTKLQIPFLFLCVAVASCGQDAPRGYQYFEANISEAREVVDGCREGNVRGDECTSAAMAVSKAEAKERSKKFFGNGKAYDPNK